MASPADPAPPSSSSPTPARPGRVPAWLAAPLRPSAHAAAILAVLWGWRGLAWWLRDALGQPEARPYDAAKGLAWDAALALAAVAVARYGGLLRTPWNPADTARRVRLGNARPAIDGTLAALGSGVVGVAVLALLYGTATRALDAAYCYLVQSHWSADGFLYLDLGWAGRLLDPAAFGLLGGSVLVAWFVVAALRHEAAEATVRAGPRPQWPRRTGFVVALVALGGAGWAVRDGIRYPAELYELRLLPEVNFARQAWLWLHNPSKLATEPPVLSPRQFQQFVVAGLVPEQPPDPRHPLAQRSLAEPRLELPVRPGIDRTQRPNVVITLVESLNRLFVHELSGHYRGVMPELGQLTRQMTVADRYWGTSSPTIAGLITALCSLHPPSHPRDLGVGQLADGNTAYACLPDLLRQQGYRTVFIQSTSKDVMGLEHFLRTHGVDEVHARGEFDRRFPGRADGPWGMHDDALVEYTRSEIERLERLRARDGRPYLLVHMTVDSHDPGMAPDDVALPDDVTEVPGGGARRLLAAYHSSDKALGDLGRFLLAPERRDRTLWVLTGDHAQFNTFNTRPLFPTPRDAWPFALLPLLIHDPHHELPPRTDVLCGTQDLAPTVLHLLGITEVKHSMSGHSLFGSRREYPVLVGRIGARFAFLGMATAQNTLPIGEVRNRCRQKQRILKDGLEIFDACALAAWLDWQDALWDGKFLFPRLWFQGDRGVNRAVLRAGVEPNDADLRLRGLTGAATETAEVPVPDDAR